MCLTLNNIVIFRLYFYILLFSALHYELTAKLLTISNGNILGRQLKSFTGKSYYAFQDIPYASPPVGVLRYKEPVEPRNWEGVLKNTQNSKICIQLEKNDPRETEDCLYLNVYTPVDRDSDGDLLPVLFFIHGGVFMNGDGTFGSYGPEYLMDYKVVLVVINYRLGAFGFIYTEDNIIPGNLGLKDQNIALKWVQKNIKYFHGDPNKVTIAGQSSGSGSVGHHILSKQSIGLFRAAIMESGSPLCSKMYQRYPRYYAYELGSLLSNSFTSQNTSQELLELLSKVSAKDIKNATDKLKIPDDKINLVKGIGNTIWAPVIEKDHQTGFVVGPMDNNLRRGKINKVPLIIGINSEEEMFFIEDDIENLPYNMKLFDEDPSQLINGNLDIDKNKVLPAGIKAKAIYTNHTFEEHPGAFVRFVSDVKYTNGIARHADLQSLYTDVFFYQFSHAGLLQGNRHGLIEGAERVGHTEVLKYLFRLNLNLTWDHSTRKTQRRILKLWTNFVEHLNPTPSKDLLFDEVIWDKVIPSNLVYLNINETLEMRVNPRQYKKWKEIIEEYSQNVQETF